jgi:DNA polymerase-1
MKTLLVDGYWNLKRNFHKRRNLTAKGENCAGVFGFLDSLRLVITRHLPDRVVVMWDGFNAGKLRYEVYKPYKASKQKDWNKEKNMLASEWGGTADDRQDYDIFTQKIKVQNFLENLFVRQVEVDYIEADDLIALYILNNQNVNEEIIIFSRDNDYYQLVSEKVSVLNPDNFNLITASNFQKILGYPIENELLLKCFEGDDSDDIGGVKGVSRKKMLKFFPELSKSKYLYKQLVDDAYESQKTKKLKIYDSVIKSQDILYRNAKLMNLKKPFFNKEAEKEIENVLHNTLSSDRSIGEAMKMFTQFGYLNFLDCEVDYFFTSFYRIMTKEKEYTNLINNLKL